MPTRGHPACVDGLEVRRTADAGSGLFATLSLCEGEVVGFYTGEAHLTCRFDALPDAERRDAYAVSLTPAARVPSDRAASSPVVLGPPVDERGSADAERHPMAAANEPREGARANLAMRQLHIDVRRCDADVAPLLGQCAEGRRVVRCCALIACRPIEAGEELTWHYGRAYAPVRRARGYRAGAPGRPPRDTGDPRELLRRWARPLPPEAVDALPPEPEGLMRGAVPSNHAAPCGGGRAGVYELLLTCNRCGHAAGLFDRVRRIVPAAWIVTDATPDALPRWLQRYGFRFLSRSRADADADVAAADGSAEPLRTAAEACAAAGVGARLPAEAQARLLGLACEVALADDAGAAMRELAARPGADDLRALTLAEVMSLADAAYMGRYDEHGARHGAALALDLRDAPVAADAGRLRAIASVRVRRGRMEVALHGEARPVVFSNRRVADACGPSFRLFGARLRAETNYRTHMVRTLQRMERSWLVLEPSPRGGGFAFVGQ